MDEKPLSLPELLRLYDENRDAYQGFCETITNLIKRLMDAKGLVVHSISSRCKGRASLEGKIKNKPKYKSLSEITDLAGVRIITHYSDDVDVVSQIIEEEFEVDFKNSIDKQKMLDPDRFGYLSRHYVVSLLAARAKMPEYEVHKDLKVEIQVRSVLQHAWAEIEHDIGYKIKVEVPDPIKRRFSRLAGLLELADQEFISIRNDNVHYLETIETSRPAGYAGIGLDIVSLSEFMRSDPLYRRIIDRMLASIGSSENADVPAGGALEAMRALGFRTIKELHDALSLHEDDLVKMYIHVNDPVIYEADLLDRSMITAITAPLYMLEHVVAAKGGEKTISDYMARNGWVDTPGDKAFKKYLLGFFEEA